MGLRAERLGKSWSAANGTALLGAVLLASAPALAQDVRVNLYTQSEEFPYSVVAAPDGFWVTWTTSGEFCSAGANTPVMRKMDLLGTFVTGDILPIASCNDRGQPSSIAVQPSGDFGVVWGDGGGGVYARLFDASVGPTTGDILVSQPGEIYAGTPRIAAHPSGDYVVVWTSNLYAKGTIVHADGSLGPMRVTLPDPLPAQEAAGGADVAVFDLGEIVVSWLHEFVGPPYTATIELRSFDGSLVPVGPPVQVSQTIGRAAGIPSLSIRNAEGIVAWSLRSAGDVDVYAARFDASGSISPEFKVNGYTTDEQSGAVAAIDGQARSIVFWESLQYPPTTEASFGIYGQLFDAAGSGWGPEFRANMTWHTPQHHAVVAMQPSGDFVLAFSTETGTNGDGEVLARRFFFPVSLALGPGPASANAPRIATKRPDGRQGWPGFSPYGAGGYGTYVGAGAIDLSGFDSIVSGPGPSPVYGPHVRAFQRTGSALAKVSFYAYGTLRFGVRPRAGDIDGDGFAEILTGAGAGAVFGPHVRGFDYDGATLRALPGVSFFAFSTLSYGASADGGEMDADGYDEILAVPGPGPVFGPQVRGFEVDGGPVVGMPAIDFPAFTGALYGATVAAADVESDGVGGYGDGYDEIVVGKGPGPGNDASVRLFNSDGLVPLALMADVLPYSGSMYGAGVAGGDVDAGDTEEIATAPGPDPAAAARILCWEWNPALGINNYAELQTLGPDDFTAFPGQSYGANVAIGHFE